MKHSVYEITLKNGAKGLLINVPGASVMNVKVQFRAGCRYAKKPELYEIAHVVEHLGFGANAKYKDEQAFESEFTKNGAYHNAWTSDLSVCYEAECADFEWSRILDLHRISITEPRFNDEELKSEKSTVRSELTGYLNDYSRLIWPRLMASTGEVIPTLRERLATVGNIELKDIREHYRRTHTAANMRFVITGRLPRHRRRAVSKMLENWNLKPGDRLEAPIDELHAGDPVLIRRKDASNITFGFSFITPRKLSSEETHVMDCLNHILNGTTSSRIFGQARKRGLIYGIGSALTNGIHNSSWDFDGEVNLETSDELFALIKKELTKVLNGDIKDADIEAAKSYALGRHQMSAQTVSQISDYYSDSYFLGGDIEEYDKIPSIISGIDKSKIVALAREYADSGIKGFAAVSSCEKAIITSLAEQLNL
ncbi:insulinase family protein [Candidatus Saccharibacteria bacterium]|nr:insulinase family protein [Candidatus Saccharibacteria bacterium]